MSDNQDGHEGREGRDRPTRAQLSGMVLYVCVGILAIGFGWLIIQIYGLVDAVRDTQSENSPVLVEIKELSDTINGCVNPEGECAKRNAEQTAKILTQFSDTQIRVLACTLDELQKPDISGLTAKQYADRIETCLASLPPAS